MNYIKLFELVKPHYERNDRAHKLVHAIQVYTEAYNICKRLNVTEYTESVARTAAIVHDVQCYLGREVHHTAGAQWVKDNGEEITDALGIKHDIKFISDVSAAVAEHRSSFKGEYSSLAAEIVSAADNGKPVCDYEIYRRSYDYARDLGKSHEMAIEHCHDLMLKKYGKNGTSRVSSAYANVYAREIHEQQEFIEGVTIDDLTVAAAQWSVEYGNITL